MATGGEDSEVRVWDTRSGEELLRIDTPEGRQLFALRFTPDGKRILTASRYESIRIWDARSGQELLQLKGHTDYVHGLAFSPDGRVLASASGDNTVRLWDARPLADQVRERDRILAAEETVRGRVERLFDTMGTLEGVLTAIETDASLGPLERHAARNVALLSRR